MSEARPGVKIVLDKERTLLLDLNGMAAFEEATGKSLFTSEMKENMGARELRALLWACLIHEEPALTLKDVGSWITAENMEEVARQINVAFSNAVGEKKEKDADPIPPPPPVG